MFLFFKETHYYTNCIYPNETPIWIKEAVIKKGPGKKLCAQKRHWILKKKGLVIPVRTMARLSKIMA